MNPPQVYMCSPSWTLLPPPSPFHPSGSSQCTSPKLPVSCIEPGLATRFIHDILHVSMPFSQIFPPCCGTYTQWSITQPLKRILFFFNFILFFKMREAQGKDSENKDELENSEQKRNPGGIYWTSQVVQWWRIPSANAGDTGNMGLISGLGKYPGEGNGNPYYYSCLENSMDRGDWRGTVHSMQN